MKHLIFMVHGIGKHSATWSKAFADQLQESYSQYPSLAVRPFDDEFKVVGVRYDDIFEERRKEWASKAGEILKVFVKNGMTKSGETAILKACEKLGDDTFLNTHIFDVLQYRFLPTVAEQVRNRVMMKIQEEVIDSNTQPPYSIISHSMGTSVTTEALHCWMTDRKWQGSKLASRFRPTNLFMVANCSRVLWSLGGSVYDSAVTAYPTQTQGACSYFGNYAHPLDPVAQVQPFDEPETRWFPVGVDPEDIYGNIDMHPEDTSQFNVHALDHYLAHPRIHADMFRHLRQALRLVPREELDEAIKEYNKTTLNGLASVEMRKRLAEYTVGNTQTLSSVLSKLVEFRAAVRAEGAKP